ncbi:hypothetical protein EO98_18795 [Methanosarcina sp. 2.H.T.1A.6]|uniref:hypothetical protein n=1 Tax=unclassified Methanosarcina TaxID=2644672 RepID=UPI00062236E9|nr:MULTISPECIES: hypothetical protein [unclassified Methanosarcina]KKG17005.1 hypothetical protein EO94_18095 [Methanosarcina sp. 2.H.T.1A.3]KKG20371.1 hypothetical protein EO98_18795 [Methanosarcina sp. 2.H.T.1A.6]KKG23364.1 hypothetical protein EO96_17060 [Methanosarcina sp. 2.H.T.1A.8]KKG27744.1 hypothetical protein EO97_00750 [Methanosarcina sp. 2.H.T.1A.15]
MFFGYRALTGLKAKPTAFPEREKKKVFKSKTTTVFLFLYFFFLSGKIDAEVSDGEVCRFGPVSVTLLEATGGKGQVGRVLEVYYKFAG